MRKRKREMEKRRRTHEEERYTDTVAEETLR